MKLKAFEADYSCGHFVPKNIKIGSVVKKLSRKNRGVGVKLLDTVYATGVLASPSQLRGWIIFSLENLFCVAL